ncbi:hemoglobin-2 [Athalia rosae]|uniref:hemoglobin-2 n=1 Tax=Athalia rosae TaxID=37344 RepID=UPI00203391B4|nr:hemoglobin-2 [Athalia rosae]XP_012269627.2 hemoglobin-2 [Athalia rosae]XP_012269628.2 hemoglobin-2 [Athalia rosae]XP_020712532.2 hemoglobin-2 [Athalia rosae]XP_048508500.1 hemoglobin-2 [Athalia rosae]
MGGWLSSYWGYAGDDVLDPATGLTGKQKRLVTETWGIMQKDSRRVARAIFMEFFNQHPEYQKQFAALKNIPYQDLPENKRFQAHGASVISAINEIVSSLYDPGLLEATLVALGEKHFKRGQTKEQFLHLKVVLMSVFREFVGSRWTTEVNDAWNTTLDAAFGLIFKAYA